MPSQTEDERETLEEAKEIVDAADARGSVTATIDVVVLISLIEMAEKR